MKTEFVKQMKFEDLNQLETELFDYVNWYNNFRPHSSLHYLTPVAFKNLHMKNVYETVDIPILCCPSLYKKRCKKTNSIK
ncbi:IS3 family transposase [Macrococcoides caseolyticum]|uniref:IS3 family transposase n=1 Tax=Macrococcoides caseolyticum TaxID=69966 RepID=UPI0039C95C28